MNCPSRQAGLTLVEVLTLVVALVVLVAIAIPLGKSWQLRERRDDAVEALLALQSAQDRHFATHARYADDREAFAPAPAGLGLTRMTPQQRYTLSIQRSADQLGYAAIARAHASPGDESQDTRCREFRLDEHGRRSSVDSEGADSTADCWNRM